MLIDSKENVPYTYRNSRDMQALLKLLDLILNAVKEEVDDLIDLLDPWSCPEQLLPLLASFVGYEYDIKETINANRMIIANYQALHHNRGSELGITMAAALSFNASDRDDEVESAGMFDVQYSDKEGKIVIYVFYPTYLQKIRDLLERVRPAGVRLEIVPAYEMQTVDKIEIHDFIKNERLPYDRTRYSIGDDTRVGFSEVTNKKEPKTDPDYPQYDDPNKNKVTGKKDRS